MKKNILFSALFVAILSFYSSCSERHAYKALIITGQNNHNWQASSPVLKQLLDQTKLFTTTIAETPAQGKDMSGFSPEFTKYDVVVLDYNGDAWPEKTKVAFVDYVKNGGGVVVYHAADNSFADWKEYNEMIGLGGWNGRTEKDGPYVYFKNGKQVSDSTPGVGGSHGMRHEFMVQVRNPEHPITKGLPAKWLHGEDELYSQLRGPAKNMDILATAYADTSKHGTGRDEPILFVISYGKGRIFHTTLGHSGNKDTNFPALECAGFITTFQRGAEWAASGVVTQTVPIDFPNSASVVQWPEYKPLSLDEIVSKIEKYDVSKSRKYLYDMQNRIRAAEGNPETLLSYEKLMVKILASSDATVDSKKFVLRELSWMGSDYCISQLKKMESSADLKDEVQFALARLQPAK
jgi:uncharacterized protein